MCEKISRDVNIHLKNSSDSLSRDLSLPDLLYFLVFQPYLNTTFSVFYWIDPL